MVGAHLVHPVSNSQVPTCPCLPLEPILRNAPWSPFVSQALQLRNEYFQRFHSTLKGLTVATEEGRLPRPFKQEELGEFWAEHCDFGKYLTPNPTFVDCLRTLRAETSLAFVAFSNSPRKYALRCLESLGVREFFPDDRVFAVEDVMPACKPEPAAFLKVLSAVGSAPERAVMFEDSMKNIRACKALGMGTVLVDEAAGAGTGGEAGLLGDVPVSGDPAVDATVRHIGQIRSVLPGLWQQRFDVASGTVSDATSR